jgi:hypothetical protein
MKNYKKIQPKRRYISYIRAYFKIKPAPWVLFFSSDGVPEVAYDL